MCCGSRKVWTVRQFFWHLEIRGGFLMQQISELLYIVSSDLLPPLLLSLLPFLPLSYVTTLRVCWLSDVQILCHPSLTASALRWPRISQIIHLTAHETPRPPPPPVHIHPYQKEPSLKCLCCLLQFKKRGVREGGGGRGAGSYILVSWLLQGDLVLRSSYVQSALTPRLLTCKQHAVYCLYLI